MKSGGKLNCFFSRRDSFNKQYALVFESLADLPDNTVIDGEIVALSEEAEASHIHYFVLISSLQQSRSHTPATDREA